MKDSNSFHSEFKFKAVSTYTHDGQIPFVAEGPPAEEDFRTLPGAIAWAKLHGGGHVERFDGTRWWRMCEPVLPATNAELADESLMDLASAGSGAY